MPAVSLKQRKRQHLFVLFVSLLVCPVCLVLDSVCLPACLSVCLFVLSVCLSALSVLSVGPAGPVCLPACLPACLCGCGCVCVCLFQVADVLKCRLGLVSMFGQV